MKSVIRTSSPSLICASRRGSLMPAVALAILVTGACLVLVANQYWLTSAHTELQTVANAAALAAVQQLASDDLLRPDHDPLQQSDLARQAASEIADRYERSADRGVQGGTPGLDVRLGKAVVDPSTGASVSLETDYSPTSALVVAHRSRRYQNPVALFGPYLTGLAAADVTAMSEASISNLILGVRPFGAATVPAWPLAVLEQSDDPELPTWASQIELRQGLDNYSWDDQANEVVEQPDGLPEITLRASSESELGNFVLVDIGSGFSVDLIARQFEKGWSAEDLKSFGDEFTFANGPVTLPASDEISLSIADLLEQQIGRARIILLYGEDEPNSNDNQAGNDDAVQTTRFVAARLMAVNDIDGSIEIVLQPAVVATRLAVLDADALERGETDGNPYLYKISITQ